MRKAIVGAVAVIAVGAVILGLVLPSDGSDKTVWLCLPGRHPDPCNPGLSTTLYTSTAKEVAVEYPHPVSQPAVDCFYVYPTVSEQQTGNANLRIEASQRQAAISQAARYSEYCRVFAPMYRQVTLAGLLGTPTTKPDPALALADLRRAFADYLSRYNHGHGFVLIGHSQGAYMLRLLIGEDIDPKPALRRRLLSAILLGGNVLVQRGRDIGGDFRYIPACHSATQLHCVIAFSTFDQPVPNPSMFGRPSSLLGTRALTGTVVLCTNPAALRGGSGLLDTIFPSNGFSPSSAAPPHTVWAEIRGSYSAQCSAANDAHVLQVTPLGGAPAPKELPDRTWGLHLLDANIALGNLVDIVRQQSGTFSASNYR